MFPDIFMQYIMASAKWQSNDRSGYPTLDFLQDSNGAMYILCQSRVEYTTDHCSTFPIKATSLIQRSTMLTFLMGDPQSNDENSRK